MSSAANGRSEDGKSRGFGAKAQARLRSRNKKFMIFKVGDERFATPLSLVKEVIGLTQITPIPNVPKHFRGLINLRGKVISIIDLRDKLNVTSTTVAAKPCIMISEIEDLSVGVIVDAVLEVIGVEDGQIEKVLDIVNGDTRDQVLGVIRIENMPLTLILDIPKAVDAADLLVLRQAAESAAA